MKPLWYPPHSFYRKDHRVMVIIKTRTLLEDPLETLGLVLCPGLQTLGTYTDLQNLGNYTDLLLFSGAYKTLDADSDSFHAAVLRTLQTPEASHTLHYVATQNPAILLGYSPQNSPGGNRKDLEQFKDLLHKLNLI